MSAMNAISASIIGRSHRLMQGECQDAAFASVVSPTRSTGLVLDGCGSGHCDLRGTRHKSRSQLGSQLLGSFADEWLRINGAESRHPERLPVELVSAMLLFLRQMRTLWPAGDGDAWSTFVATRLLTTIVGYLVDLVEQRAWLFWIGDGFLCLGDDVIELDSGNAPAYLAFSAIDDLSPAHELRVASVSLKHIRRIAVASDGWHHELLERLPQARNSLEMQRWMNIQGRIRPYFEDDGAIASCWLGERQTEAMVGL